MNDSIRLLEHQLTITRDTGDRHGEAKTLLTMGSLLAMSDEKCRSVECLNTALSIFRETSDVLGQGHCLWGICLASVSAELDHPEAEIIDDAQEALRIFRRYKDPTADLVEMALKKWQGKGTKKK